MEAYKPQAPKRNSFVQSLPWNLDNVTARSRSSLAINLKAGPPTLSSRKREGLNHTNPEPEIHMAQALNPST